MPPSKVSLRNAGAIYLSLAIMLTFYHVQTIDRPFWVQRSEFHQGIINGDFKSPYQYRILVPWLAEAGGWTVERALELEKGKKTALAREMFYALQRLIFVFLLFIFFHLFLRKWFSREMAFAGTLLLAGLHLYTYRSYYYQPDSPLNILFLTIALYLFTRGEYRGWLYILTFLGSLNRETFGLIVPLHLAYFGFKKETLKHTAGLFLTWLAVQVLLRMWFGIRPPFPYTRTLIDNLKEGSWLIFLFGLMWVIPLICFSRLPVFFKRGLLLFAPPLVLFNLWFGKIEETRIFLDLALILIPGTFFALFGSEEKKHDDPEAALKTSFD